MPPPGDITFAPDGAVTVETDAAIATVAPGGPDPVCCGCTTEATLYAKACPCGSVWAGGEPPNDCSITDPTTPAGECVFVDIRSRIADAPADKLGDRLFSFWQPVTVGGVTSMTYTGPTIKIGTACYRFVFPDVLYAFPSVTPEQRAAAVAALTPPGAFDPQNVDDLPAGAVTVGGDGVVIPVAPGCGVDAGCEAVPTTSGFYEAVACNGGPEGQRWFVCVRLSYAGQTFGCRCIVRGRVWTSEEIAALMAQNPGLQVTVYYDEPVWDVAWKYGTGHPNRRPAGSCCICLSNPGAFGTDRECLSSRRWTNVWGANRWSFVDVCCGRSDGFTYRVELEYVRTITQPSGARTAITARIDRVVRRSRSVIEAQGTVTTTGYDAAGVLTYNEDSPLVVNLAPTCCLYPSFDHRTVPTVGGLLSDGSTFVDDYDGSLQPWYQLDLPPDDPSGMVPELPNQLRHAWNATPWAVAMQVCSVDQGGTYTGTGVIFGSCLYGTFRLEESTDDGFGRTETVKINLHVDAVHDNSAPCGFIGQCGPNGWHGRDITELIP